MRTIGGTSHKKRADKKYIHEIYVDHMTRRTDLKQLCDKLCETESQYLNPTVISKTQVSIYSRSIFKLGFRATHQAVREGIQRDYDHIK